MISVKANMRSMLCRNQNSKALNIERMYDFGEG